jgi:hypothetical protein
VAVARITTRLLKISLLNLSDSKIVNKSRWRQDTTQRSAVCVRDLVLFGLVPLGSTEETVEFKDGSEVSHDVPC